MLKLRGKYVPSAGGFQDAFLDNFQIYESSAAATQRGGEYAAYETKFNNNYASVDGSYPGTGGATYDTLHWADVQARRTNDPVAAAAILLKGTDWWAEFKAESGWPANAEQYAGYGRGLLGMWYRTGGAAQWADDLRDSADYSGFYKSLASGLALDPDNEDFSWRVWAAHTGRMIDARIAGIVSGDGYNYQTQTRQCIDILIDQGQNADWSLRTTNRNLNCQQVFMQGFAMYQATRHYWLDSYRRTELLETIREVCEWVSSAMLDGRAPTKTRFLYIPSWDDLEGGPAGDGDGTSLADVNGFWLTPFGELYRQTGDPLWRTLMLDAYATMNLNAGVTQGRKQFEESFCFGWQVSAYQALSPTAPGWPIWTVRPGVTGSGGGTLTCDDGTTSQTGGAVSSTQREWWEFNPATNEANGGCRVVSGQTATTFNQSGRTSGTYAFPRVRKLNAAGWSAWRSGPWTLRP